MSHSQSQNTIEEWRPVVGFESDYEVSNLGHLRRLTSRIGKPLEKPNETHVHIDKSNGYVRVMLSRAGRRLRPGMHQVVAAAFIGPCPDGMEVDHMNGDKTDNQVENLRYLTRQENALHATRVLQRHIVRIGIKLALSSF